MNANNLSISLLAGLAAAAMTVSAALSPAFELPLGLFTALPLFVAGFIGGPASAALAGIAAAALLGLGFGWEAGLVFLAKQALAPALVSHMSLQNREAGEGPLSEGEMRLNGREWYPEGRLLLWVAGVCFLVLSIQHLLQGEAIREFIRSALVTRLEPDMAAMDAATREATLAMISGISRLAPLFGAGIMVIAVFVNMRLAAAVATASGKALRPWARFGAMRLPRRAAFGFAAATGLGFVLPGIAGEIALIAMAALFAAFLLTGLALVQGSIQSRNTPETPKE